MKLFLTLFLSISSLLAFPTLEYISIDKQEFTMTKETYDIYNSKGLVMSLYSKKKNHDLGFALNLILHDVTGDCGKKSIQKGTYSIEQSTITLYHLYRREGHADYAPYGAMIDVYEIQKEGELQKVSSKVYIESSRKKYNPDSGMKYLFEIAKNEEEKALFAEYINDIEKKYKSTFVFEEEAQSLIQEVKRALKKDMWK